MRRVSYEFDLVVLGKEKCEGEMRRERDAWRRKQSEASQNHGDIGSKVIRELV